MSLFFSSNVLGDPGELDKKTKLGSNGSLTSDSATSQTPFVEASSSMSPSTTQNTKARVFFIADNGKANADIQMYMKALC